MANDVFYMYPVICCTERLFLFLLEDFVLRMIKRCNYLLWIVWQDVKLQHQRIGVYLNDKTYYSLNYCTLIQEYMANNTSANTENLTQLFQFQNYLEYIQGWLADLKCHSARELISIT